MTSDRDSEPGSFIDVLAFVTTGKATVAVGGRPFLSVDADARTLEVEADGVSKAGLHLSDMIKLQEGGTGILGSSMKMTGTLSRLGWKLNLYSEGEKVLSMGSGVSRLTGRVSVNPLRLRKLVKLLK